MDTLEGASTMEMAMMYRAELRGDPLTGSIELLPLCNMNCDMCYVRLSRREMESQGRLRTGEEWISIGRQMIDAGTLFLLLTGGEPLLHPDFKDIYLGLKKMGMILTINTNGTLIDEEWAEFFGKYKPRRINITLYGGDGCTYERLCHYPGGYDKVVNAVRLLREENVDVKLAGSITPHNVMDVDKMISVSEELGVPMRMDTYMMPSSRERSKPFHMQNRLSPEDAAKARIKALRAEMGVELFSDYRKQKLEQINAFVPSSENPCPISCHAGRCSFTVNWQGMIRPCVVMTDPQVNVFETGFADGWKQVSKQFCDVRYCAKCSNCRLRPLCRTCAAAAKLESGDYLGTPDYLCRYAEESLRQLRLTLEDNANE